MYECVILYRVHTGHVRAVVDPGGNIRTFANLDEAITYCDSKKLFKIGDIDHQIVELDEL